LTLSGKTRPQFTRAFRDALNQGILDAHRNPTSTSHSVNVNTTSTSMLPINAGSNKPLLPALKRSSCCLVNPTRRSARTRYLETSCRSSSSPR
jgi:hypothetical protein